MRIRNAPGRCSGIWQKSAAELSGAECWLFCWVRARSGRAMHIAREACRSGVICGVFAHSKELARSTKGWVPPAWQGWRPPESSSSASSGGVAGKDHSVRLSRGETVSSGPLWRRSSRVFVCVYLNNKHHVVNIECFSGYDRWRTGIPRKW